ncbi:hypothetical protein SGFS_076250 [Streptomyces graminofaciens]|uniref:Uncharacterized protein n=1 Tax=Streptomyces graminofaciens TaxID=68212 RepID=A0ABM7FJ02_9ACTN|nr:hypothetical protein [Streptomyces graminofaciens]BBC36331.1 hypothetical protein SGFS_076250 [Streptomyces graminofaciens]
MGHITGRVVRTAIGTAAALATLALPLVLGIHSASSAPAGQTVVTAVDLDGDGIDDGALPKPPKNDTDKGSWVWDKEPI